MRTVVYRVPWLRPAGPQAGNEMGVFCKKVENWGVFL